MISAPPQVPQLSSLSLEVQDYLLRQSAWLHDVYAKLRYIDLGEVKILSGATAPSGGQDGDVYVRVAAASTAVYLNINGSWSAYANP